MLEIEVKFLVDDLRALRKHVVAAGAVLKKPRIFERNVRYDDDGDTLLAKQALLRLRQDSTVKITYKGMPNTLAALQSEAKVREEIEIEVSDFDAADLLLQRLGFEAKQVYEKYRETFQLGDVEIVLDEMPYGNFIELEGSEAAIREAANRLGLDWQQRVLTNYLSLLSDFNRHHGLSINDLTFANFADINLPITPVLS